MTMKERLIMIGLNNDTQTTCSESTERWKLGQPGKKFVLRFFWIFSISKVSTKTYKKSSPVLFGEMPEVGTYGLKVFFTNFT